MSTWLFTSVVVAILINLFTILISRKVALRILPWLFFYISIVIVNEILAIDFIKETMMEISRKNHSWVSYPVVILICVFLGVIFWRSINIAVEKIDKATSSKGSSKVQAKKDIEIPSLKKLFNEDFPTLMRSGSERKLGFNTGAAEEIIMIPEKEYLDFHGQSKFVGYFIPFNKHSYEICEYLSDLPAITMKDFESKAEIKGGLTTEISMTSSNDLVFSGRVYIYHEDNFSLQQLAALEQIYKLKGLAVLFRGPTYLTLMSDQKWKSTDDELKK